MAKQKTPLASVPDDEADESTPERPVITRYTDYRAYIRDMVTFLKATMPQFSYRFFARRAGFASPSFLKLVAEGKRNLSQDSVERFARGLGLDNSERAVFETLVLMGQATTDTARNRHYIRLQKLTRKDPVVRLQSDQYDAYSKWYPFVIRELTGLPGFREDPDWIGKRLRPRVRPKAVTRAMKLLQRLGLLVRRDGALEPAERNLSTGPEVRSLGVRNFHRNMLTLASRALDGIGRTERNITSLTVPLSASQYERVCTMIAELRRDILQVSAEDDGESQEVHQICFTLVPVTQEVPE